MKKTLSFVVALILLLSTVPVLSAPSEDTLYEESAQILKSLGILHGNDNGDLMLEKTLKRQDMVVLISRLYGEEDTAKNYPTKDIFNDIKDDFYKPYIYWAVDKGLIQGTAKNTFGYTTSESTKYYTKVQQLQALLLRALGYGSEVNESYESVPEIAEKIKIMDGISADKDDFVTRGLMAAMTLNALKTNIKGYINYTLADKLNLTIPKSIKVDVDYTIYGNTVVFQGMAYNTDELNFYIKALSENASFKEKFFPVNLEEDGRFEITIEDLEGGEYEYRFALGNLTMESGTFEIEELPFELSDIIASNLKEITLEFTQPVDVETSQFTSKYFTNAGTIKSVRFENNNKTVILTLNETMENQNTYEISISDIISEKGDKISVNNWEFEVFDNKPPEAIEVIQLGNKGLKVIASEPIKSAKASNFKIDDNSFRGKVSVDNNIITLTYYSTYYAPDVGNHTLKVSGLLDYANFIGVDKTLTFKVVEDTDPPKVVNTSATTEKVTIEFDEDIDPDSITRTNFYWKSGYSKKYPSSVNVYENKLVLDFTNNNLPTYEISIFINKVEDYSENVLKSEEIKVKPILDTTLPQVVGLDISQDGKTITVYFSKNVKGNVRNSYDIRDKENNKVSISKIEGSGRVFYLKLGKPLPAGNNKIRIENIVDTTSLENLLIPYEYEFFMKDVEVPTITSYSGKENMVLIKFSKKMDIDTVFNTDNYVIKFNNQYIYLPEETDFSPLEDELTYILYLPEEINGRKVDIGETGNLTEIMVSNVKAINDMAIEPTVLTFDNTTVGKANVKSAKLTEPNTIIVTFDQPIVDASVKDFTISGKTIENIYVDFSENVILYLDEDDDETYIEGELTIKSSNSIETYLGSNAESETIEILDKVAPSINTSSESLRSTGRYIYLPFTERLNEEIEDLFKYDLIIEALGQGILDISQYSTALDTYGDTIRIKIEDDVYAPDGFAVRLVEEPKYIMDESGNIVQYDGNEYYTN